MDCFLVYVERSQAFSLISLYTGTLAEQVNFSYNPTDAHGRFAYIKAW